jgi:hypothetical protein
LLVDKLSCHCYLKFSYLYLIFGYIYCVETESCAQYNNFFLYILSITFKKQILSIDKKILSNKNSAKQIHIY